MATILVVDDDPGVLGFLSEALKVDRHTPICVASGEDALALSGSYTSIDVAFIDVKLPGVDGVTVIAELRKRWPGLPVVVITGFLDHPVPVQSALRAGSCRWLEKPLALQDVRSEIRRALGDPLRVSAAASVRTGANLGQDFHGLIGGSPAMRTLFDQIARIGPTRTTVLIQGETGTGKEIVARALHACSGRTGRFVPLNCAAAGPDSLLESEFFGHERGAFTGAIDRTAGWFESAKGGTIFLDEIGDLSLPGQAKLLRVLEQREYNRLGGRDLLTTDVRIVAATHRSLAQAVAERTFRDDLYYRLIAFEIHIPPLRHRPDDIPLLARHLMLDIARDLGVAVPVLSEAAAEWLQRQTWPGNVRQLRTVLARACANQSDSVINSGDLSGAPFQASAAPSSLQIAEGQQPTLAESTRHHERRAIEEALGRHPTAGGAARALGLSLKGLYRKRVVLGLIKGNRHSA